MTAAHSVQIFQDHTMEFRWAARSGNGDPIEVSVDSWVTEVDATRAAGETFPDATCYLDNESIADIELPQSADVRQVDSEA